MSKLIDSLKKGINYTYTAGAPGSGAESGIPVRVTVDTTDKVNNTIKFVGVCILAGFALNVAVPMIVKKKGG